MPRGAINEVIFYRGVLETGVAICAKRLVISAKFFVATSTMARSVQKCLSNVQAVSIAVFRVFSSVKGWIAAVIECW